MEGFALVKIKYKCILRLDKRGDSLMLEPDILPAHSFCHYCGQEMEESVFWNPEECPNCGNTVGETKPIVLASLIAPNYFVTNGKIGVYAIKKTEDDIGVTLQLPTKWVDRHGDWQNNALRAAHLYNINCCDPRESGCYPDHVLTGHRTDYRTGDSAIVIVGAVEKLFSVEQYNGWTDPSSGHKYQRLVLFPDDEHQLSWPVHRVALAKYWETRGLEHQVVID